MKLQWVIVAGFALILTWIVGKITFRSEQKDEQIIIRSSPAYQQSSASVSNAAVFEILENFYFDKIVLKEDTLQDSIEYMRHKLNAHAELFEIDFIVRVSHLATLKKESLSLENVSAVAALQAIALKYGVSVFISKQSVVIDD